MVQLISLLYPLLFAHGALSAAMRCTNCDEPEPPLPPSPPPPPPPPPPVVYHPPSWSECTQEWYGTSPFCNGVCPPGSRWLGNNDVAIGCQDSTPEKVITCIGASNARCLAGNKALCEVCVARIEQA